LKKLIEPFVINSETKLIVINNNKKKNIKAFLSIWKRE